MSYITFLSAFLYVSAAFSALASGDADDAESKNPCPPPHPRNSVFFLQFHLNNTCYFFEFFVPDNIVCFYTKNAQKVIFSQRALIIQDTFLIFCSESQFPLKLSL